ncbi:hypothetical protein PIB30_037311 [Stylosanthes scabra]|uniref:Uncharacterized protein n=1 Tax=Stylosanthes scabra TaxID=79078 RepID=A0ABU6YED4_9FABA|nr:hypothetical protein [Stylosanthes scabra]
MERVLLSRRYSFLIHVPEQLMLFMVEVGFGHAIQLRDFAFDAPLLSALLERWRCNVRKWLLTYDKFGIGAGVGSKKPLID